MSISLTFKNKILETGGGITLIFQSGEKEHWIRLNANHEVIEVSDESVRTPLINASMAVIGSGNG